MENILSVITNNSEYIIVFYKLLKSNKNSDQYNEFLDKKSLINHNFDKRA